MPNLTTTTPPDMLEPPLATYIAASAQFNEKPVRLPSTTYCATYYAANLGCDNYQAVCFANAETMHLCEGRANIKEIFFSFVGCTNTDKSGT